MRVTLETDRLLLRPYTEDDADAMFNGWAGDEKVTAFLTWNAHRSVAETRLLLEAWVREYEKPERLNFAIVLKEEGKLIGSIDVVGYEGAPSGAPVLGYCLSRAYHNRGIMTEACKRVISYLFERGFSEVRIDAMPENAASNAVIKKCGGILIGVCERERPAKNDTVRINRYVIRKTEGSYC